MDHITKPLFQKLSGSRYERFLQNEKSLLKPLPQDTFTIKHITAGKGTDELPCYFGGRQTSIQCSAPIHWTATKIIYDEHNVEIYIGFQRIALHKRDYRKHGYTTLPEHMPESTSNTMRPLAGMQITFYLLPLKSEKVLSKSLRKYLPQKTLLNKPTMLV